MVAHHPTDSDDDRTSVYRYFDEFGLLLYVGITGRGGVRNIEHDKTKDWWRFVARQEVEHLPTRQKALAAERRAIEGFRPPFNVQHNHGHAELRRAYINYRDGMTAQLHAASGPLKPQRERSVKLAPLGDRRLASPPSLAAGTYSNTGPVLVSTPYRMRAGIAQIEFRAGVLMVSVGGKYLPAEISHGRALLKWDGNAKPPTFAVTKVILNEAEAA